MRFSASIAMLFNELPVAERFAAARTAGFDGVEIQSLAVANPSELARAAQDAGIDVVLVNVGPNDYATGGLGLSGVPGREGEFRSAVEDTLAAARRLGARLVHLGPSRVPPGVGRDACLATYRDNIEMALDLAAGTGSDIVIEAMNRVDHPSALNNDVDQAADLIRRGFLGRIGLQFDVYHTAMNGHRSPPRSIATGT